MKIVWVLWEGAENTEFWLIGTQYDTRASKHSLSLCSRKISVLEEWAESKWNHHWLARNKTRNIKYVFPSWTQKSVTPYNHRTTKSPNTTNAHKATAHTGARKQTPHIIAPFVRVQKKHHTILSVLNFHDAKGQFVSCSGYQTFNIRQTLETGFKKIEHQAPRFFENCERSTFFNRKCWKKTCSVGCDFKPFFF